MIRTAIPFGYLFVVLFLAGVLFTGVTLMIVGWWWKMRAALMTGVVMAMAVLAVIITEVVFDASMEWNPYIANDSQVIGTWTDNEETITLRTDHTAEYKSDTKSFSGKWTRNDWNLHLTTKDVDCMMRFIRHWGELRLMTHPPEDSDMWDGDLGLRRQ